MLFPDEMLHAVSKFYDRQFHRESLEIVFDDDIPFSNELVTVVQIAQADTGGRGSIVAKVDDVLYDGIAGRDGYVDGQGCFFIEFVVLNGILHQRLHGYRRYEEVFRGEVGDLDDHADGVAKADLEQVEIVADELNFFFEEHQVLFLIAEDVPVYFGQGVVV